MHTQTGYGRLMRVVGRISFTLSLPLLMKLEPYEIYSGFGSAPSKEHILGTDSTGRDLFARLIYGGRTSLFVGFFLY